MDFFHHYPFVMALFGAAAPEILRIIAIATRTRAFRPAVDGAAYFLIIIRGVVGIVAFALADGPSDLKVAFACGFGGPEFLTTVGRNFVEGAGKGPRVRGTQALPIRPDPRFSRRLLDRWLS